MIQLTWYFLFILIVVTALFGLLFWSFKRRGQVEIRGNAARNLEVSGRHIIYLRQIRQALDKTDLDFVKQHGSKKLSQRVRKGRKRVALQYLSELDNDFRKLLRLASVVATLSPQVAPADEWERLLLSLSFSARCQVARLGILVRLGYLPQLDKLGQMMSGFGVRLEDAMSELGERAALASEMASSSNR